MAPLPAPAWLTRRPIAHRGLHDDNVAVPENSLAAARRAADAGFAVECDVLLSRDGVPMIFHDDTLERMTGARGRLAERTAAELGDLRLVGGGETVPSVEAFLAAVDGRVPVVMELKGTSPAADEGFLARLAPVLGAYRGDLALMSFDPWLIDQALAAGTHAVGLTAEGTEPGVLDARRAVFAKGCAFTSYNWAHLPNPFVSDVRASGAPVITWTVRTPEGVAATRAHADQMTFEGFLPQS